MYTRDTIIGALKCALESLFDAILKTQDNMLKKTPPEDGYEATFEWGQYANPSFEAQIETLVKAKTGQIMSTKKIVDELYGDSMDEDEKAEEVARIKAEYGGGTEMPEPSVNDNDLFGDEDIENIETTAGQGGQGTAETPANSGDKGTPVLNGGNSVQGGTQNS